MRIEIHPDALPEYTQADSYYAKQQDGLQAPLHRARRADHSKIQNDPERYRFFEEDVRRCLTPVFPHAVLYTIEPEFIHIAAVTHCARQPGYWKERLADD